MKKMTKSIDETAVLARLMPLADLRPNPNNARTHPEDQVEQIAASIKEFGFTNPMLVDIDAGCTIVAGHGRRLAMMWLLGAGAKIKLPSGKVLPKGVVPVIDCSGWTEAQRRAYTLADNRLAETSQWDEDLLKLELSFLSDADFSLDLSGFTDADLSRLISGAEGEDTEGVAAREWEGMPEFAQGDKTAFRTIPVHFKNQAEVDAFAELIGQPITLKTRFIWSSGVEIETYADKRYASEGSE